MSSQAADVRSAQTPAEAVEPIQVLRPSLPTAGRLLSYIRRIDAARTYTNWGMLARELESRLALQVDLPVNCVTLASSGSLALVGATLAAAGRATVPAPVALIPAFTFVATALTAELLGFRPCLTDVDADTWTLQAGALEAHEQLSRAGLVVPVAPFGRAVPQAPWLEFRRRTGIPVVIDGGASFEAICADPKQFLGPIPVALSFHATKSFSTAEGGCILTSDPDLARQMAEALNFGFAGTRECTRASTNGKMSEYHAAIGLAELDGWNEKHANLLGVAEGYRTQLSPFGLTHRLAAAPLIASCYVLFRCEDKEEAAQVMRSMSDARIESRFWYGAGLHRHPHFAGHSNGQLSTAEALAGTLIALPVAPDLSHDDIRRVIAAITRAIP